MALAITHVLIAIVILDIFRHYVFGKKKFPRYLLVVGGIAALAPDIDVIFGWLASLIIGQPVSLHGLFTHSIIFPIIFLIIGIIFHYKNNIKWASIFYVISFGLFIHISLDCLYGGEPWKLFLWPSSILPTFCPRWNIYPYGEGIDAIILVFWLIHEEIHHRIKDYI